jgi:hypothetical protein
MCKAFDEKLGELRVARAYIELLSARERDSEPRMIPVVRIGNYEIRIVQLSQNHSDSEVEIRMDLFDHGTQLSVDSSCCREIEDALVVLKEFIAQIKSL